MSASSIHDSHAAFRGFANPQGGNQHRHSVTARRGSLALGIVILVLASLACTALLQPRRPSHATKLSAPEVAAVSSLAVVDVRTIDAQLQRATSSLDGHYGISVIDLTSGTAYGIDSDSSYRAASLNKMPILVTLYQRADSGTVNLDDSITLSDDDIQHYGTGLIQDPNSPRTFTLRQLAAVMIETSDNTAAYVLERYLGQDAIQANLQHWGLVHTSMADNTTTPADTAKLFAGLQTGHLLQPASTGIVLDLLRHTVFNDRLVAGVPQDVPVAHKVGTDVGTYNDAGLIVSANRPYAIAVLSQDADENQAESALAQVSAEVYQFESGLTAATRMASR